MHREMLRSFRKTTGFLESVSSLRRVNVFKVEWVSELRRVFMESDHVLNYQHMIAKFLANVR